jgi:ferredoxin
MKVNLDRDRCEGHGLCEEASPQLFRLDDEGELEVLQDTVDGEMVQAARAAARVCPVAALSVTS